MKAIMNQKANFKWISPRDQLPDIDQLIWILQIENREGNRGGFPCANIYIAVGAQDRYGTIRPKKINHKGYESSPYSFFSYYSSENNEDNHWSADWLISAWMPYHSDDLPSYDYIVQKEAKEIVTSNPRYKYLKEIESATRNQYRFIHSDEYLPEKDGLYAIVNEEGVWLSRFEIATCIPWIAPNGKKVKAWYPVPDGY